MCGMPFPLSLLFTACPRKYNQLIRTGKTPLDYVPCISEAFQRITKGSSYYRRILLLHKPKGTTTYKAKMEKRLQNANEVLKNENKDLKEKLKLEIEKSDKLTLGIVG